MSNEPRQTREEARNDGGLFEIIREWEVKWRTSAAEFVEPVFPYIVLILAICGVWAYLVHHHDRYKMTKNLFHNTVALTFLVTPKFDSLFPRSSGPESMLEFLFRRIGQDYQKYRGKMRGRVLFWVMRIALIIFIIFTTANYLLKIDDRTIFSSLVTVISSFLFTVVLTGAVSYVLAYFGYRAVWDRIEKTDLAEMRECAISIWKNMEESGVAEGFKVRKLPDCAMAAVWAIIDDRKSILQIDFRIFSISGEVKGIDHEITEMKLLLAEGRENWWDYRIVLKSFKDGSYSKMIDYANEKSERSPVRVCEIDGNHRDDMKIIMEAVHMLKPSSMRLFEQEWREIRKGYKLRNYDAESYG